MSLEPGTIIAGRYRVVRTLGRGGMGTVLEVVHADLGERYALKMLTGPSATDAESLSRFANEGRVAARLRSDHLVRVTDMGQLPSGEPFLVMDYLEGMDLEAIVARGPAPIPVAVSLVLQACAGLAMLHAQGFVHRDVKPSNLFLTREHGGRQIVKVLDFGLAKVIDPGAKRLTSTHANFGTPAFMAPEQVMSAKNVDPRCDQHAIGLVLFELLTGRSAFDGETVGAITVAIATQPAPLVSSFRPDVPPALDAAVARALAKRPDQRFSSLSGLARALAPFGGPDAPGLVTAIERILGPAEAPLLAASPAISAPHDARTPRLADITASPTTRRTPVERPRRALFVVGLSAVLGIGAGLALTLIVVTREQRSEPPAAQPVASSDARAATTAEPEQAREPPPAVTPAADASAAASAGAGEGAHADPLPAPSTPRAPSTSGGKPAPKPTAKPTAKPNLLDDYTPKSR